MSTVLYNYRWVGPQPSSNPESQPTRSCNNLAGSRGHDSRTADTVQHRSRNSVRDPFLCIHHLCSAGNAPDSRAEYSGSTRRGGLDVSKQWLRLLYALLILILSLCARSRSDALTSIKCAMAMNVRILEISARMLRGC